MTTSSLAPSAHYTDQRGVDYLTKRQSDPKGLGYELNFAFFKPYLKAGDHVLDFGCGNGGMLPHVQSVVCHVDGFEVNLAAAEVARATGCQIFQNFDAIPPKRRYDAVVTNHVLEHVRDVPGTLAQVRDFLKPGGILLVKLPIDDWRDPRQRAWEEMDVDHHLHTWTPRLFANVLHESGFEVREARILTFAWHPRLFPLIRIGLGNIAFRLLAMLKRRRQLFVVGMKPLPD